MQLNLIIRIIFFSFLFFVFNVSANTKDLTFQNKFKFFPFKNENYIFDQITDHNNPVSETFSQRYWHNDDFAKDEFAPVILDICGESTCYGPGGSVVQSAQILGARIFTLEHRYYGESFPVNNLKTSSLKFLTIEQALKDLVYFKTQMEDKFKLKGKWISIGGSYAGALSAYLKNLYPDQFVGALASSAPVHADADFSEYDQHVAKVAGRDCQMAVLNVVTEVEKNIATDDGFKNEMSYFGITRLTRKDDFLYLLADTVAGAVQYGMKKKFCDLVTQKGKIGYAQGVQLVSSTLGNLEDFSFEAAESTDLNPSTDIGMRQWMYQSCNEFGFFQNVSPDDNLRTRSKSVNAQYHINACKRLFNINFAGVDHTNHKYFEPLLLPQAKNIFFTNGEDDPWMILSLITISNPKLDSIIIKGAAHCNDLHSSGTTYVEEAKEKFRSTAKLWLSEQ